MRFSLMESGDSAAGAATVCRISAMGTRWRVRVESWKGVTGWSGRLVFEPESPSAHYSPRLGPPTLRGRSQTEVLDEVHQLPEQRLRQLLHSFG